MKPLDQRRLIDAHKLNHTATVIKKSVPQGCILEQLMNFADSVPDFRRGDKGNFRHRLSDIIILMILGRACGHVGRADIIEFGKHNLCKFRRMGLLKNGMPSEATLCRVENGIDDSAMADRMQEFAGSFRSELLNACSDREIICVDGKAERGTVQENGRNHWSIESMHWGFDVNLLQDKVKRKSAKAARNLDTIQRIVCTIFSAW